MDIQSKTVYIEALKDQDNIPFNLLELADPSPDQIKKYLNHGKCFVLKMNNSSIGVMVLEEIYPLKFEIKNLAISEEYQGYGYGKKMLEFAIDFANKSSYKKLIIATGNSSIGQLALYQKVGFEIVSIEKDHFIQNYPNPIFENGIQCKHKVVLEFEL